jgi:hypothetical protein
MWKGWEKSQPRFQLGSFRIWSGNVNHSATPFALIVWETGENHEKPVVTLTNDLNEIRTEYLLNTNPVTRQPARPGSRLPFPRFVVSLVIDRRQILGWLVWSPLEIWLQIVAIINIILSHVISVIIGQVTNVMLGHTVLASLCKIKLSL